MIGLTPKGIPFVRATAQDGSAVLQFIERPTDIDVKASRFIACGGRYFIVLLKGDEVRLSAAVRGRGGEFDMIASEVTFNGFMLPHAVDRMVNKSTEYLDQVI